MRASAPVSAVHRVFTGLRPTGPRSTGLRPTGLRRALVAATAALVAVGAVATPALAAGPNLIANPSVETAASGKPANWTFTKWGTNTTTSTWQTTGQEGGRSLAISMTARTDGDAKWSTPAIPVTGNTQYTLSDFSIGNVVTSLEAQYTLSGNQTSYVWLTDVAISASWKQNSVTFTTPANATKITIFHILARVGSLQTDNYSLTSGTSGPNPSPSVSIPPSPSAPPSPSNPPASPSAPPSVSPSPSTPTSPPAPVPGNLVANPSFETAAGANPANWSADHWGTNTAAFSYLTTGHTGTRSVRTDVTAYTNGDAKWSFTDVNVQPGHSYQFTAWYQSNVATEIDAAVTAANGTVDYQYLTTAPASAGWAQVKAEFTVGGTATKVTVFQAVAAVGFLVVDDVSLTDYVPAGFNRAMVSLTFDDGWRSQYTNGYPLLTQYGLPATFYLLTGTTEYPDYMTVAQMQDLGNHGHELSSHTISHPHLPTLNNTQLTTELANSKSSLQGWFGTGSGKNFASPYGEYNPTTVAKIKQYYRSHRSTDEGYNSKDSFDIWNIKVQNILDTTTPAQVAAWVDQAIHDKTWLVLCYHEVDTATEDPTYAVTPANLNSELSSIKSKGVAVLTVDAALTEIQAQL